MSLGRVLDAIDLLDAPVRGPEVTSYLTERGLDVHSTRIEGQEGFTDFLEMTVPGSAGKRAGGNASTTGVIGRLGGIGARPDSIGLVSDGDGAVAAIAVALTLARLAEAGEPLPGDVIVATHICPDAPTLPHDPVPFMGPPVPMDVMNEHEVSEEMDAVLAIDTTKGNRILNWKGIAITSPVLAGWVLPVSEDLVDVYESVCGTRARVLPLSTYDITPYGNGLYHINSILQPAVATRAPVVGVAITAETVVPGTATGSSHPADIALAASFCVEVAKRHGAGRLRFHDPDQHDEALRRYGSLETLQTMGSDDRAPGS